MLIRITKRKGLVRIEDELKAKGIAISRESSNELAEGLLELHANYK